MKYSFNSIKTSLKIIKLYKNWINWYLAFFGYLKKENLLLKLRSGELYFINSKKKGLGIVSDIYITKPYHSLFRNELKNILDLGGHIGVFSILAAKKYPNSTINVYEPSPENYKLLMKNLKVNKIKNVNVIKNGISNKTGKLNFYISADNSLFDSFIKTNVTSHKKGIKKIEKINVVSLNSVFDKLYKNKICDALKIDIEGMEVEIFNNFKHFEKIKTLVVEVQKETREDFINLLKNNNFKIEILSGKNIIFGKNKIFL